MTLADERLLEKARALLTDVTPLPFDCGTLCGHKCCNDYAPDVGVYLMPGELPLFDGTEDWTRWQFHGTNQYEFPTSWSHYSTIPFLMCKSPCERTKRPLACRIYPLAPYLTDDDRLEVRYDPFADEVCPLVERYRTDELRPDFVAAVQKAWEVLIQDPEMLDYVRWMSAQIKAWTELPHLEADE